MVCFFVLHKAQLGGMAHAKEVWRDDSDSLLFRVRCLLRITSPHPASGPEELEQTLISAFFRERLVDGSSHVERGFLGWRARAHT